MRCMTYDIVFSDCSSASTLLPAIIVCFVQAHPCYPLVFIFHNMSQSML